MGGQSLATIADCEFFASKFNTYTHQPQTMPGLHILTQHYMIYSDAVKKQDTFFFCFFTSRKPNHKEFNYFHAFVYYICILLWHIPKLRN